jgi:hypothetical protein
MQTSALWRSRRSGAQVACLAWAPHLQRLLAPLLVCELCEPLLLHCRAPLGCLSDARGQLRLARHHRCALLCAPLLAWQRDQTARVKKGGTGGENGGCQQ